LLWLGRSQKQILDRLRSAVLAREGVLLLTGDVGTGKTILTKALLRRLRADAIIASVMYVGHSPLEFLKDMGGAFGADGPLETTEAFYRWLPTLLDDAATQGKRVLLCVDEAQSLDQELLTELGRLASVAGEPRSQARLSILLVGQSELNAALSRPENAALAARAGVRCVTEPLTGAEIGEYVAHQLKIGGSTGVLFTERGLQELAAASQGIPRLVNTLADLALLSGSKHGTPTIGAEVVRRCALGYPRGRADRSRFGLPARPRPGRPRRSLRPAALYAPALALLLGLAGYFYQSARPGDPGRVPATSAVPSAAPAPGRPGGDGVAALESARASVAPPPAPLGPRTPDPVGRAAPNPHEPAAAPSPPSASLRQASPPAAPAAEARRERDATGIAAAARNQPTATTVPTGVPRGSGDVRPGQDSSAAELPPARTKEPPARPVLPAESVQAAEARRERDVTGIAAAARNQPTVAAAQTGVPRGSGDARPGRDSSAAELPPARTKEPPARPVPSAESVQAADPTEIIDWLLSEYPARRQ
jgi:type II secretory pathway predicted ATPase ExeA